MSQNKDRLALEVVNINKNIPLSKSSDDNAASSLQILQSVSLEVGVGQSVAITGASGSGKTTLLGILAGLDSATDGDVLLLGESMSQRSEDERAALRKGQVGFVFQAFHLLDHLTALENVMLPLELDVSATDLTSKATEALNSVGLGERVNHLARQLSGGEQQRVALARAFVTKPSVLFADEPTGNLDANTGEDVIELLFNLKEQQQTTLIMVTHDEDLAKRCDKHYRLVAGHIAEVTA